jgi:nucleotide-binding universal stress UspA family protein
MKKNIKSGKTILVGVDYTKSSANAIEYAAMLAAKGNASLMLFHIYEAPVIHTNSGLYFISYKSLQTTNRTKLEKLADSLRAKNPSLPVKVFASSDSFKIEVENLVGSKKIQYIVLGLESKTRISKFIYGSHGTSIAGKVDCPVIIVPEKYKAHKLTKAVLAVDNYDTLNTKVMSKVKSLSTRFNVPVNYVHVRPQGDLEIETRKGKKDIELELVEAKEITGGIIRYSKKKSSDLIIIVSQSHSPLYNFFNESNTKTIAFQSKIPVMAIHE